MKLYNGLTPWSLTACTGMFNILASSTSNFSSSAGSGSRASAFTCNRKAATGGCASRTTRRGESCGTSGAGPEGLLTDPGALVTGARDGTSSSEPSNHGCLDRCVREGNTLPEACASLLLTVSNEESPCKCSEASAGANARKSRKALVDGNGEGFSAVPADLTARLCSNVSSRALAAETETAESERGEGGDCISCGGPEDPEEVGRPRLQARHQHTAATTSDQDMIGACARESCQRTSPQCIGLTMPEHPDNNGVVTSAEYKVPLCTAWINRSRRTCVRSVPRQYVNISKSRYNISWLQLHSRVIHLSLYTAVRIYACSRMAQLWHIYGACTVGRTAGQRV